MQVTKDYIRQNIQEAARELFLERGYPDVSMREIANRAQVGLSNIYNYFKSKDELFVGVMQPVIKAFNYILEAQPLDRVPEAKTISGFRNTTVNVYINLIKNYQQEINVLLFQARGSSLQNFKEVFTKKSTEKIREILNERKENGEMDSIEVSDFTLHLHAVWLFTIFEEFVKSDVSYEELEEKIDEYVKYELTSWGEPL